MGVRSLAEPLLEPGKLGPSATPWSCFASLIATMVGIGILSLPISFQYCGLFLGIASIVAFGLASDLSLQYLVDAAELVGAQTYADLGARCFGARGKGAVVACLLALLVASAVIVHIVVTDLSVSLLSHLGLWEPTRAQAACALTLPLLLLSLPSSLQQLRTAASASLGAIALTLGGLIVVLARRGVAPDIARVRLSPRATLAMPVRTQCSTPAVAVVAWRGRGWREGRRREADRASPEGRSRAPSARRRHS